MSIHLLYKAIVVSVDELGLNRDLKAASVETSTRDYFSIRLVSIRIRYSCNTLFIEQPAEFGLENAVE